MLWHKEILEAIVTGGTAGVNTTKLKGKIEQLVVTPLNGTTTVSDSSWTLKIIDKDNDIVTEIENIGVLDDRSLLPVGRDESERFTFKYTGITEIVTSMRAFMKVRERD